jgi:PAS domain S-box-containing protein
VDPETPSLAEALLASSPDAVIVVDEHGVIEMASPAVTALFGYKPDELVGQPVEVLVPDEARERHTGHHQRYQRDPVARAMGANLELMGRRSDGTVFPVDVSLAPATIDGELRVGAFVRDVTERRRSETLLRQVNEISRAVLSGQEPSDLFSLTAKSARDLLSSATAWIAIRPTEDARNLTVAAASGRAADEILGVTVSISSSIAARAMSGLSVIAIEDMASDPNVIDQARHHEFGPGLYLPMLAESGPVGTLVIARERGDRNFGVAEVASAEAFASAAAVVLALGRARQELEELKMTTEHERIARDLHDTVIQKLFALGMGLQAAHRIAEGQVRDRVDAAVEGIDEVIREIRETIFDLGHPNSAASPVRHGMRQVIAETTPVLGFTPRLAFRGPVESEITDEVLPHLLSVTRESLSNVARHAQASAVDVVVQAGNGLVTLRVADDGIGITVSNSAGYGLENMRNRAEQLGGSLSISVRNPAGTVLTWSVPSSGPEPGL